MDKPKSPPRDTSHTRNRAAPKEDRADRLAEELRANLMKRKEQARARKSVAGGRTDRDGQE